MRAKDVARSDELNEALLRFNSNAFALDGIASDSERGAFLEQLIESLRRVEYVHHLTEIELSPLRADPASEQFDPYRAAILSKRAGDLDEALWLVFLSAHFGKHRRQGWRLAREVYRGDGAAKAWTWRRVSKDPSKFVAWLGKHEDSLRDASGSYGFGNHRKYQSISASSSVGTGAAVDSYVQWVLGFGSHAALLKEIEASSGKDPHAQFQAIYDSMSAVTSFGRTARFDYLTMAGKLGIVQVEPGHLFLDGATGPLAGSRRLLSPKASVGMSVRSLTVVTSALARDLGVPAHVLEDALCNWQKSPRSFLPFRG